MNIGEAIEAIQNGKRATREAWEPDVFIFLVPGSTFTVNRPPLLGIYPEGTEIKYRPHIDMCYTGGSIGVWSAKQADLLANDWSIYPH